MLCYPPGLKRPCGSGAWGPSLTPCPQNQEQKRTVVLSPCVKYFFTRDSNWSKYRPVLGTHVLTVLRKPCKIREWDRNKMKRGNFKLTALALSPGWHVCPTWAGTRGPGLQRGWAQVAWAGAFPCTPEPGGRELTTRCIHYHSFP